jgi:hypothetical protein
LQKVLIAKETLPGFCACQPIIGNQILSPDIAVRCGTQLALLRFCEVLSPQKRPRDLQMQVGCCKTVVALWKGLLVIYKNTTILRFGKKNA